MPASEASYSVLSFSKQPSRRKPKPDDRISLRTSTQKGRSQVEIADDLPLGPLFDTSYFEHYPAKVGINTNSRVLRGSEAHYNHGKTREKVIYPYRNASQVELGKDSLDYGSTSHQTHCLAADKAKYLRPERTSAANCRTKSNVNLSHADHTPYIKGLPLMALSMPELDPNKLRGRSSRPGTGMSNASSVRVGSKAKLGGNADVKVMSPLMAAAHRQTLEEQGIAELAAERNARLAAERELLEQRAALLERVAAAENADGEVGEGDEEEAEGGEGGEGEGEAEEEEEGSEYEYTDHHHLDPLLPSTMPPNAIPFRATPERVNYSRGSVNKMESQIRIGWTTEPPLYVSHEHSAFQQQDVKKYKPVGHQITKSKVKLKYQRGSPQDYVSATHEHFPDRSATVKSDRESGELGTRIMGDRRQRHTVTVQRGDMDGPYSRNNKYLEDFLDVDTGAHAPTLIRKGKQGKTLSQLELDKQTEDDPWEADPKGMYATTAERMHGAKHLEPLWRQEKDFKFRSQVEMKHPIRNKHNQMKMYVQREKRLLAAQQAAARAEQA
eukprot:jgi/Tetstr1/455142/TSEL_041993.t1